MWNVDIVSESGLPTPQHVLYQNLQQQPTTPGDVSITTTTATATANLLDDVPAPVPPATLGGSATNITGGSSHSHYTTPGSLSPSHSRTHQTGKMNIFFLIYLTYFILFVL